MVGTALASLQKRADDLHASYQFGFAGKPRVTRRLTELDRLVSNTKALLSEIDRAPAGKELAATVRDRLAMYESERGHIVSAQSGGPELKRATQLGSRANFWFGVYARHFAGHSRSTRDVALLDDVVGVLEEISAELGGLLQSKSRDMVQEHLGVIEANAALYSTEREAILAARRESTPAQLTSALANLANQQFEVYRGHFANKPRLSRRPALLDRVVASLEACRTGMQGLSGAGEAEAETNRKNIELISQRLESYRAEADAIRRAREGASVFDLIDALGQSANAVMEEYATGFAGQDRQSRSLGELSLLIDQLLEIERQMWAIAKVYEHPTNEQNTLIVHDTLLVYAREYDQIRDAQKH